MAKGRGQKGNGIRNGNRRLGGNSGSPKRTLTKKLQYLEVFPINNGTTDYAYLAKAVKPDIRKATGAIAQFAAYELWRLKKIQVSVQLAPSQATASTDIQNIAGATIWTAADFGNNESSSGKELQQYQNAKRNTLNWNKWVNVVDTTSRINARLNGGNSSDFIMPTATWVNTNLYDSSDYSGYQVFVQLPGFQNSSPSALPSLTFVTTLTVEFMQPAFQASASSFQTEIYDAILSVIPDGKASEVFRDYKFLRLTSERNVDGNREYKVIFERVDGKPGTLTYTDSEFRNLYTNMTSGQYFSDRRVKYTGPSPSAFLIN